MITKTITLAGAELSSFLAAGGQTVNPNDASPTTAAAAAAVAAAFATTSAVEQVPFPTLAATTAAPVLIASTTPVAIVPTTTTPTIAALAAAAVTTSTSSAAAARPIVATSLAVAQLTTRATTTTSLASSSSAATSALSSTTTSLSKATSATSAAIRSSAVSSGRVSSTLLASSNALSSAATASKKSGISGGGIAGLIIGLLILFGLVAAAFLFWRKRRAAQSRAGAEKSRRAREAEKGVMRLKEEEVASSPNEGTGFDFGHLPQITPASQLNYDVNHFNRSASPAVMQQGANVLGIQRPFTPPPGHPAHPNYQPPAMAGGRPMMQMQQQQQQNGSRQTMERGQDVPRRPIPGMAAGAAMVGAGVAGAGQRAAAGAAGHPRVQRQLSSNNPFSDPIEQPTARPESIVLAAPLARTPLPEQAYSAPPEEESLSPRTLQEPQHERNGSVNSFVAGDDSFEAEEEMESQSAAPTPTMPISTDSAAAAAAAAAANVPLPVDPEQERATSPVHEEGQHPARTKSVMEATDNWAARKQHLKNKLALQTGSAPTSPSEDQSPFADPPPTIEHEISALSPMDLEFSKES